MDFAVSCPLLRYGAFYSAFVHRLARLFHASFGPRLATIALASSLGVDFHIFFTHAQRGFRNVSRFRANGDARSPTRKTRSAPKVRVADDPRTWLGSLVPRAVIKLNDGGVMFSRSNTAGLEDRDKSQSVSRSASPRPSPLEAITAFNGPP